MQAMWWPDCPHIPFQCRDTSPQHVLHQACMASLAPHWWCLAVGRSSRTFFYSWTCRSVPALSVCVPSHAPVPPRILDRTRSHLIRWSLDRQRVPPSASCPRRESWSSQLYYCTEISTVQAMEICGDCMAIFSTFCVTSTAVCTYCCIEIRMLVFLFSHALRHSQNFLEHVLVNGWMHQN